MGRMHAATSVETQNQKAECEDKAGGVYALLRLHQITRHTKAHVLRWASSHNYSQESPAESLK